MNYWAHYDRLIVRARNRNISGYTEMHHVVPRCLGGNNDKGNLVELTAEEHFVAHQLLIKIFPEEKGLVFAAVAMTTGAAGKRVNNKRYGWIRRKLSKAMRNNKRGAGRIVSNEARAEQSKLSKKLWCDPEFRAKVTAANTGEKHPMFGRTHSSSAKTAIGKATKKLWDRPGHRDLIAAKQSSFMMGNKYALGCARSEETRLAISESLKGEKHPMFGKHLSDEHRAKTSASMKKYRAAKRAAQESANDR